MVCRPKTPYAIAKLSCTNILLYLHETQKFPVTILRLFQAYGPKQDSNRICHILLKIVKKTKNF